MLAAARAYREAAALDPGSVEVAIRGYRQAVLAGDKGLALSAARSLDAADTLPRDAPILLLIDALDGGKWDEARGLISRLEQEESLAFVVPFMTSWVSLRDGPYDPPVVPVDKPYAMFAVRYLEEQLLLQRLAQGDASGAADAYRQAKLRGTALGAEERAQIAARFAALGRRDTALDLLGGEASAGRDPLQALTDAERRYAKVRFTAQTGLGKLLYRLALDLLGHGEDSATLSIARMASFADPGSEDIRLLVAEATLGAGHADAAYAEAAGIAEGSAVWLAAQSVRLRALLEQDRVAEAVAGARKLAGDSDDPRRWRLLGDILTGTGDFTGAAQAYVQARSRMANKDDPALLLQLSAALERAGRWSEAKPMLEKVIELAPDSATALNHLGYALADRGEDLPRAITLLEKANRLRPDEPAFVDSLGWALFRAGENEKALPLIRRAVAAEPGNPELNEHLGDILWAMGRRFEARYAWKAALVGVDDDGEGARLRSRVERKLGDAGVVVGNP